MVAASVNSGKRADVKVGEKVIFTADVTLPENVGSIVKVAWDFDGSATFSHGIDIEKGQINLSVETGQTFDHPGVYFPAVRVTSHREGDAETPFAQIRNLDRVRVVVE